MQGDRLIAAIHDELFHIYGTLDQIKVVEKKEENTYDA